MLTREDLRNSRHRCSWTRQLDRQFEGLPGVLGIDGAVNQRDCGLAHQAARLLGECFEGTLEVILGQFRQQRIECPDKMMLQLGFEQTDCAEDPRRRWHQHRADFERASHLRRKKRTVAAEGDQCEVSGISAALDRNGPHRTGNAGAANEIGP